MYGILDMTWKPSADQDTPPAGKSSAIYRNNSHPLTVRVTDGTLNGFDDWEWTAQIRAARLTGETAGDPAAEFAITLEVDGDDLLVHLLLTPDQTTGLVLGGSNGDQGFWDLQLTDGTSIATWLAGKVKLLNDVSRAA